MNPVFSMFNDITKTLQRTSEEGDYIANFLTIAGASGDKHQLTIDQLQLFLGILKGDHRYLSEYNPLEFMLFSYDIQHKVKANWVAKEYSIMYDDDAQTIYISAIVAHPTTVKDHPDYIPGAYIPFETIQTTIPDVGVYGSLALINCIAAQGPEMAAVRGAYGSSFIYEHKDGKVSVREYDPAKEAMAKLPTQPTIDTAITRAVEKIKGQTE